MRESIYIERGGLKWGGVVWYSMVSVGLGNKGLMETGDEVDCRLVAEKLDCSVTAMRFC